MAVIVTNRMNGLPTGEIHQIQIAEPIPKNHFAASVFQPVIIARRYQIQTDALHKTREKTTQTALRQSRML